MIYPFAIDTKFKQENLENWHANSQFWLEGKMRHLSDVHDFMAANLASLVAGKWQSVPTLIDVGCGEGWLLRVIREQRFDINYVGVDFNEKFIEALRNIHAGDNKARFVYWDIEKPLPEELLACANIAVNSFNFFEIPDIEAAFRNVASSLKPGGLLLVLTIDPIVQLISISHSMEELQKGLFEYQHAPGKVAYDKQIETQNGGSGRIYKGILYSAAQYVQVARHIELQLIDYQEVAKTGEPNPQLYQLLIFQK